MAEVKDLRKENYQATQVTFEVFQNGEKLFELKPEKRFYLAGRQIMTEADIDAGFTRDLYVALGESLDKTGKVWSVRIYVKSFMRWVWLGALFMGFGGFIAMFDKRYRKLRSKNASKIVAEA